MGEQSTLGKSTIPIKGRIIVTASNEEERLKIAAQELLRIERTTNERCARVHIFIDEMEPEQLAQMFHETYERLAPEKTLEAWNEVPEQNKNLMIAVAKEILIQLRS